MPLALYHADFVKGKSLGVIIRFKKLFIQLEMLLEKTHSPPVMEYCYQLTIGMVSRVGKQFKLVQLQVSI